MRVNVLGAGTMGHGTAQMAAMAGHEVMIRNIKVAYVDDGLGVIEPNLRGSVDHSKVTPDKMAVTLDRLSETTSLEAAVTDVDLVIEAVPEDTELKRETVVEVESLADSDAVIASNTSSLSVTQMLSVLECSERGLGLHFFNPVHIMGLVEVVVVEQTSESTLAFATEFVEGIDKIAVEADDSPGFVSSRPGVALDVEAMRMAQEDVTSPADVGTTMEFRYNRPMGPLELGDAVGLDVRLDILEYLREELGERFCPPQTLKRKVRADRLGKKTGEGFYVWEDGEVVGVPEDVIDR